MRWIRGSFVVAAVAAVVSLQWVNWTAQKQTQGKLDALLAREVTRPAEPAPAPLVQAAPVPTPASAAHLVVPAAGAVPRELEKVALPPYIVEAPDLLQIEAVWKNPKAADLSTPPPVTGQFVVRPDGTVGLGLWGSVAVAGLTIEQAAAAVREHLANQKRGVSAGELRVSVDVIAMNSKRYYIITDALVGEEQVYVFPITGSETVLDAVRQLGGLAEVAGKRKVWIARKSSDGDRILPIDWNGITQQGLAHTNYQIMPGDRLHVSGKGD